MLIKIKDQSPWRSYVLVIQALIKRELITSFGKFKLGALWFFIDPLLSVIFIGLILGPLVGRSAGDQIPYPFFLLCGFMLLKMCTGSLSAGVSAISSNQGLLVFKKVQPLDLFIARFVFQLFVTSSVILVFCIIAYWIGIRMSLEQLPEIVICVLLTWMIGSGLGLQLGIASEKNSEIKKIATYLQRPLLWISCVLHPLSAVPPQYTKYLLYNPLTHTIEYMRICLFPNYVAPGVNLYYPAAFALCSVTLGIMTYRNNRLFLMQR